MKKNNWTIKMLATALTAALVLSTASAFAGEVQYERKGRFVKRVVAVEKRAPAAQTVASATPEGAYSRKGRFVKHNGLGGKRGISKTEVTAAGVRHDHGINGKAHRNVSN